MDPDQLTALIAAAGGLLAALGLRRRRSSINDGPGPTAGLVVARTGAGIARLAGNLAGTAGRIAVGTTAAGIRAGGATVAHTAGLAVDGVTELNTEIKRAGRSLVRRTLVSRPEPSSHPIVGKAGEPPAAETEEREAIQTTKATRTSTRVSGGPAKRPSSGAGSRASAR